MPSDRQTAAVAHDHEFVGVFEGPDGHSGRVTLDNGRTAWLPLFKGFDRSQYRFGRRVAFDTDYDFGEKITGPRVTDATFLERDYQYDLVATVAYEHGTTLYLDVGDDEDVKTFKSGIWKGHTAEVGDEVAIDWVEDEPRVIRGEVR